MKSTTLLVQPIAIGYFVSWFSPFDFENFNALIDGSSDGTRQSRAGQESHEQAAPRPPSPRLIHLARFHDHPRSSKILPQPYDSAPDSLLLHHGEVFIPPVERMQDDLPTDFLKLPQEAPL